MPLLAEKKYSKNGVKQLAKISTTENLKISPGLLPLTWLLLSEVKEVVPHLPTTPADFEAVGLLLPSAIVLSNWMLATGVDPPLLP